MATSNVLFSQPFRFYDQQFRSIEIKVSVFGTSIIDEWKHKPKNLIDQFWDNLNWYYP